MTKDHRPEPTHHCITCGAIGIPDEVVGCKTCGFDDMQPLKSAPEPRAEVTDYQIADMFERVTGYSIENGRAALNDADILGFARELLEAARTGASS
ncbi:hypothetical protein [Burkholderia vietnamiensis]|uniref:hypothetical protein n=1 Tax=Burkholderia vietnamiensis TaxID=60552 RepID=UPI0007566E7D|nr:hypothetical protein [Burkholderia vietnamiensis]KVS06740.1 hypothetical protein WK29_23605 [Burkholderia vietnamiensis]